MKTRTIYEVFIAAILFDLIIADKNRHQKDKENLANKWEDQEQLEPAPKLEAAAGFNNPVTFKGYDPANVQKELYQPRPYRFGYEIKDKGGKSFRHEEDDGSGSKKGSYGYRDAYGIYRIVEYVADHNGFRAAIRTNEPGTASSNPAHVNIASESQPPIGQGVKQGRAAFAPTDLYSVPRITVASAPLHQVNLQEIAFKAAPPPPQSPQPTRYQTSLPLRPIGFETPLPPQQILFVQTAPTPIQLVPQQQIRFIPSQQRVRFVHEPAQHLRFGPPRPRQFIARPPVQRLQKIQTHLAPARVMNNRPQIEFGRPILHASSAIPLRPALFNQPYHLIKPSPSVPIQIGAFHNRPGLRPVGAGQPIQLIRIRNHPGLRPIGAGQPIQPIRIENGLILKERPVISNAAIVQRGFYGQNALIRGDEGSLKVTAGAPIIGGRVNVEKNPTNAEGLTRNILREIRGGIRKGISDGHSRGTASMVAAPITLYQGFRDGQRNSFLQGLRGAHSGENNEGQEAVAPPEKQRDRVIFVGPFPGRHQGGEISHIVASAISPTNTPNKDREGVMADIDTEEDAEYRKAVDIPGQDPAFIGPGPAPKFRLSDTKKKSKDTKPGRRPSHG